jgi:hypothetical protein
MILLSVFAGGLWIIPLGILLGMLLSFWQAYRQSKGNQFQEKQIYLENGVKKSRMVDTGKPTKPVEFWRLLVWGNPRCSLDRCCFGNVFRSMILAVTIASIILAAFFKAVADTLSHHFDTSVFAWRDKRFWDPAVSWQYAHYLKGTKYKVDAWHLANSGMIICFCLAVTFGGPIHLPHIQLWGGFAFSFMVPFSMFPSICFIIRS